MQPESLQQVVGEALRNYEDLELLERSPLAEMVVVQRWPTSGGVGKGGVLHSSLTGLAVRRLLERAVAQFSESHPHDARVIEERFFRGRQIKEIEAEGLTSSTNFYSRLNKHAIPILSRIIMEWEVAAWDAQLQGNHAKVAALPSATYEQLIGVEPYLEQLRRALTASLARPGLPFVVTGLGGIGKTSLVNEAVRCWLDEDAPPIEKVLFAAFEKSLGQSTPYSLEHVLIRLGEQVGLTLVALPNNEQRLTRLAEQLRRTRYIVVLDNIEQASEVEQALQLAEVLSPTAQLFITSRHTFDDAAVRSLTVGELPEASAIELLQLEARRLGYTAPDTQICQVIVANVGGHPLALKLVAGQMQRLPLATVLDSFSKASGKAQGLFTHIYEASWEVLSAAAQTVLLGLLLLPEEGAGWNWLEIASATESQTFDRETLVEAVEELTMFNLLQVSAGAEPWYSLHRLTYYFLAQKAGWVVEDLA